MDHGSSPKHDVLDRSVREQNRFVDHCIKHQIEVTLYLESGTQFIGYITRHDRKCLILAAKNPNKPERVIFKSYISLVRPNTPIELFIEYRGMGTARSRRRQNKA